MPKDEELGIRVNFKTLLQQAGVSLDDRENAVIPAYIQNAPQEKQAELLQQNLAFANSLKALMAQVNKLYARDRNGQYVRMGYDDMHETVNAYDKALADLKTFAESAGETDPASPLMKITDVLTNDRALLRGAPADSTTSLPECIAASRRRVYTVDENLSTMGAMQSARIPVTCTDPDGTVRKGFFTVNETVGYVGMYNKFWDDFTKKHPEAAQAMDMDLIKSDRFRDNLVYQMFTKKLEADKAMEAVFNHFHPDKDVHMPYQMFRSANRQWAEDMDVSLGKFRTKVANLAGQGSIKGTSIEERNGAMSAVAELLGVPHLIAKSEKGVLNVNGRMVSGVFMETAEGYDIDHLPKSDVGKFKKLDSEGTMTPAAYRDESALSVLDFICCNIDRHIANVFYQFDFSTPDKPKLIGVKGIDNDASFGTRDMSDKTKGYNRLPPLQDLTTIPADMAEKVMRLNKPMLQAALRGYDLAAKEIDACWDRVRMVQEQIQLGQEQMQRDENIGITYPRLMTGKMRPVKDDEWGRLAKAEVQMCTDAQKNNYLYGLESLPGCFARPEPQFVTDKPLAYNKATVGTGEKSASELLRTARKAGSAIVRTFRSSPQYDHMLDAMSALSALQPDGAVPPALGDPGYNDYRQAVEKAYRAAQTYIDKKVRENDTTGSNSRVRVEAATAIRDKYRDVFHDLCDREVEVEIARLRFCETVARETGDKMNRLDAESADANLNPDFDPARAFRELRTAALQVPFFPEKSPAETDEEFTLRKADFEDKTYHNLAVMTAHGRAEADPNAPRMTEEEIIALAADPDFRAKVGTPDSDTIQRFVMNDGEMKLSHEMYNTPLPGDDSLTAETMRKLEARTDFVMTSVGRRNVEIILKDYEEARSAMQTAAAADPAGAPNINADTMAKYMVGASLLHVVDDPAKGAVEYLNTRGLPQMQKETAMHTDVVTSLGKSSLPADRQSLNNGDVAEFLKPEGQEKLLGTFRGDLKQILLEKHTSGTTENAAPAEVQAAKQRTQELAGVKPEAFPHV